jgi:hypothetical protein
MSAAILQGCPTTTLDTNWWIDLPPRQYMRVLRLCQKLGATTQANTVVELSDGSVVNFLYPVDGLLSFAQELRRSLRLKWLGTVVSVLPLSRILASKRVVGRPKTSPICPCWNKRSGCASAVTDEASRPDPPQLAVRSGFTFAANTKSLSVKPSILCVHNVNFTFPHAR